MAQFVPERGDILRIDFHPTEGREQDLVRPALVLSPKVFNARLSLALVAPITSKVKGYGLEVLLDGCKTQGVVLCHQIRVVDYVARNSTYIEKAPATITDDALAKVRLLVG